MNEVKQCMAVVYRDQAAEMLAHYLGLLYQRTGGEWTTDMETEVKQIVALIVAAAR